MIRTNFYLADRLRAVYLIHPTNTQEGLERAFALVLAHMGNQITFTTFPKNLITVTSSTNPQQTASIIYQEMPK